jgi:hypothetical protein
MKKQKQKIKFIILIISLLSGFFIYPKNAKAADTDIIINEIGAYEKSENEWLEIFNKGTEAIDLTGWKFYEDLTNHKLTVFQNDFIIDAGEYAIIANVAANFKSLHPDFNGTILDSSWSSLKESGEEIGLKNSNGDSIELFTYIPCSATSLQRIDANLSDYTDKNWQTHQTSNSAGKINEFSEQNNSGDNGGDEGGQNNGGDGGDEGGPDNGGDGGTNPPPPPNPTVELAQVISSGTVVINEFVSDPADGDVEWIELYNKNAFDINLSGWKIFDGAETATNLSGTLGSNFDNRILVIENPKGKLNNSGDAIILKDDKNNIIDTVYYGNWASGFVDQNAPVAKDPNSVARIFDGANTYNNNSDFVVTQTPTKGEVNIITLLEEAKKDLKSDASEKKNKIDEKEIVINEIYPNPIGSDLENEFIELKNTGTQPIDLAGWKIKDNSKKVYTINAKDFPDTIINPGAILVIERKMSQIALNNNKDTIKLVDADDKTIQTVKYSEEENVPEDVAYISDENGDWFWTTMPTKGQENILTKLNHAPEINLDCTKTAQIGEEIICDASDSYDLDDDNLIFNWQMDDLTSNEPIVSHKFTKAGSFIISLIISDGKAESKETQKIKITAPEKESTTTTTKTKTKSTKTTKKPITSPLAKVEDLVVEPNNQPNQILKYLVSSAVFLGLGIVAVIKKKKKAPSD